MREVGDWTRVRPLTIEDGEWNPYTLEWDCPDPAPTATPTPRPQPPQPDPDCTFDLSTFTWECPPPTATNAHAQAHGYKHAQAHGYKYTEAQTHGHAHPDAIGARLADHASATTTIDVGGSTTVTAEWEPPGLSTWLGFATDSTAVLGRSSRCSGTRFVEPPSEATLTVYGC